VIHLGEGLVTARRACGLTQAQLAEAAGVTQAALSRYESDLREPDADVLARMAAALGVTVPLLTSMDRLHGALAVDVHMRRRATAKATDWRRLEARLNLYRARAGKMLEELSIRTEQRVPTFDPIDTDPRHAAMMVRMQWRMPIGPVRRLIQWLESAGCLVISEDFDTSRVDGLSQWINDCPVILINSRAPVDRLRLTLAHELGHLSLHSNEVSDDVEAEANRFASEFLMPTEVIKPQLRNLTVAKLLDLKREWGASMQALAERAYELDVISADQRTNLYKSLSAKGWRTREPVSDELPPETPELPQNIGEALRSRGMSSDEIAEFAGFSRENMSHPFRPQPPALRSSGTRHLRSVNAG